VATATRAERPRAIVRIARVGGIVGWASFLAASVATMVCFAFVDPQAFAAGHPPAWWGSRMQVYAVGFFFFWLTGAVAATVAWLLAHPRRRR
jgi:hypothetical protein